MTNYEKNKELINMYAAADVPWGVTKDGEIIVCGKLCSKDCIFKHLNCCSQGRFKWLQQEYKEPEVDWSKVEIDTLIFVRDYEDARWTKRHFAGYFFGRVHAFQNHGTSDFYLSIFPWEYAKIAEQESD